MSLEVRLDALIPQEMAEKAEATGVRKAALPFLSHVCPGAAGGSLHRVGCHVRHHHRSGEPPACPTAWRACWSG